MLTQPFEHKHDVRLTIICVAYKRYREMPVLIHSLMAQTDMRFKLIVIHDGYDAEMEAMLSGYAERYPDHLAYQFTQERYNDYGHTLRELGIVMADTDYLLLTNDDNYYCPIFVERMLATAEQHAADIVMCDMIHSHDNPGGRPQLAYNFFPTGPQRCAIDIGCFIARTELAKQVGFRDKTHDGDATYFEDLVHARPDPRIAKVNQVLLVHN